MEMEINLLPTAQIIVPSDITHNRDAQMAFDQDLTKHTRRPGVRVFVILTEVELLNPRTLGIMILASHMAKLNNGELRCVGAHVKLVQLVKMNGVTPKLVRFCTECWSVRRPMP